MDQRNTEASHAAVAAEPLSLRDGVAIAGAIIRLRHLVADIAAAVDMGDSAERVKLSLHDLRRDLEQIDRGLGRRLLDAPAPPQGQ